MNSSYRYIHLYSPPIIWSDPQNPEDAQPGYGFIADDTTEEETFFYHSDHLGSTSYITDDKGNITQYDAYLPYGELLVDEHSSSEDLPYKFNGKELDEETGLYYYGARYMNPMASIWYGVDQLTEKYVGISGYTYCLGNPVKLVDEDGRDPGDFFENRDLAAMDFGKFYNSRSIKENREYAAYIYKTKDKWGNVAYSYTIPVAGGKNSVAVSKKSAPKDAVIVADIHTHADDIAGYDNNNFSNTDKKGNKDLNLPGYLVTPKGYLKLYIPGKDETTTLSVGTLPRSREKNKNGRTIVIENVYRHKKGFETAKQRELYWYKKRMEKSWWDRNISSRLYPIKGLKR